MLQDVPLFQDLSDAQLDFLISLSHRFTYPKHSILLNQGEMSNSLFIVLEGRLKVFASGEEGKQTVFAFLGPGKFVGELSLLDDGPRSASVKAVEDTQVLLVTQEAFYRFVDAHPETLLPMLRIMATRLRIIDETVCALSTQDVYGRLSRILQQEAEEENGKQTVPRMTHQDIAEMVGSSREMVSRILKELRMGGYISIDGKRRIVLEKKLPSNW